MNKLNKYHFNDTKSLNEILKEKGIFAVFNKCNNKTCFCTGLCMEISHYETNTGKRIRKEDIDNYIK